MMMMTTTTTNLKAEVEAEAFIIELDKERVESTGQEKNCS
jgi:hypothetical protein